MALASPDAQMQGGGFFPGQFYYVSGDWVSPSNNHDIEILSSEQIKACRSGFATLAKLASEYTPVLAELSVAKTPSFETSCAAIFFLGSASVLLIIVVLTVPLSLLFAFISRGRGTHVAAEPAFHWSN